MLIGGGAYTLLPLSGPPYTGIELHEDAGVAWEGDIEVTGRWAYSVSAPQGIVHAMREYVAYLYRAYDRQGVANGQDFDIGLPEHLRQLLVRYQRIA
jgi:hypothetical protein